MAEEYLTYMPSFVALVAMAFLYILQILIADFAGIYRKHPPGSPVAADHNDFHFRAVRAHANTNESIAAFLMLFVVGILVSASANSFNICAGFYVLMRALYTGFYYLGWQKLRSTVFGLSLVALVGMLVVAGRAVI